MSKKGKKRSCPALGREITASDCGENRHGRYACPPTCPHDPFAVENYTALLAIEDAFDRRTSRRLFEEAEERSELEYGLQRAMRDESPHGVHAFMVWRLFFHRDVRGLTCGQRWAEAGYQGMNNDERVFLQAKMQLRVVLLEVHRILDEQRVEVVDLLAPEAPPMIILDRSLAGRVSRFSTLLGWAYPLPHFWRLSGSAILLPEVDACDPLEVLAETVRHLGGPAEVAARRLWLAEHFVRVDASFRATAGERHRLMLAGADAQPGVAIYSLQAPFAECRAALDADPEIDDTELLDEERGHGFAEARDWFDDKSPVQVGRAVLGQVLLGQVSWQLKATGAARLAALRERFEKRLGARVRFERERRDDVGLRRSLDIPKADPALVPPRLLEAPPQVGISLVKMPASMPMPMTEGEQADIEARYLRDHWRTYPDQPVPMLDGKTPRQAVADPLLRKKVLKLIKAMVRQADETNLRKGRNDDIGGLVRELGLVEIDFPPPPRRAPPKEPQQESGLGREDPSTGGPVKRAPRRVAGTPPGPLSEQEAIGLLQRALNGFETAAEAMDALKASGATVLEDVSLLTEELLSDKDFSFIISFLLHAWFTLVPPGADAPELDIDAMEEELERELEQRQSWIADGPEKGLHNMTLGCRQPVVMQLIVGELFAGAKEAPKKLQPKPESLLSMVAVLKVVINEVDRALRA